MKARKRKLHSRTYFTSDEMPSCVALYSNVRRPLAFVCYERIDWPRNKLNEYHRALNDVNGNRKRVHVRIQSVDELPVFSLVLDESKLQCTHYVDEALKEGAFLRFCYCAIDLREGRSANWVPIGSRE